MPIKVRTGIPCSLNKVPNLSSCFFCSFPYCEAVYTLLCFSRNVIFRFILVLSFHQGLNSSFTTQMTLGFHNEETHLQGLPSSPCFLPMCLPVFLPNEASPASQSPPAHFQGLYQMPQHPENTGLSLSLTPHWPFMGPLLCLPFFCDSSYHLTEGCTP